MKQNDKRAYIEFIVQLRAYIEFIVQLELTFSSASDNLSLSSGVLPDKEVNTADKGMKDDVKQTKPSVTCLAFRLVWEKEEMTKDISHCDNNKKVKKVNRGLKSLQDRED